MAPLHDMFVFKHTTWIPVGLVYQLPAVRLSGFNAILVGQIPCCQTKSWLFGWLNPSCFWFSDVFVVQNLVLLGQIPSVCWFWTNLLPDIWHIPTMSPSISPLYRAARLLVLHLRNAVDLATALSWALCSSWVSWVPKKLWGVPQMTSETGEKSIVLAAKSLCLLAKSQVSKAKSQSWKTTSVVLRYRNIPTHLWMVKSKFTVRFV